MRVLPTNVNRRRELHIRHGAVGGLCDLKDGHVQLEGRVADKTLLNGTSDGDTAQNQNSDRSYYQRPHRPNDPKLSDSGPGARV